MKTIKQLEAEQKKVRKQLQGINADIEERKLQKELPKLRKKYEGKYWKYENGTSSDCRWWLYSCCRKVIDDRQGLFDCFQMSKANYDDNSFKHNQYQYYHLCQIEITKEEYLKAFEKFKSEFQKLAP